MKGNGVPPGEGTPGADQIARFFMGAFLAALGMLFLSTLALYCIFWARAPVWPPAGTPPLPALMWLGLALLLGGSWSMQRAISLASRDMSAASATLILASLCLALAFCGLQIACLRGLLAAGLSLRTQFGALVVILAVLHLAHVVGGVIALLVTYMRARRGVYRPGALASLRSAAAYWHFLDIVWVAVLLLLISSGWH